MVTWAWCGSSSPCINGRSDSNELHQIHHSQSDSTSAAMKSSAPLLCFLREGQPFSQMEQRFDYTVLHHSQCLFESLRDKNKKGECLRFSSSNPIRVCFKSTIKSIKPDSGMRPQRSPYVNHNTSPANL